MTTDTSEKGLDSLIVRAMIGQEFPSPDAGDVARRHAPSYGGWLSGHLRNRDYDFVPEASRV